MPSVFRQAAQIGVAYDEHRHHIMQNRHQGLTTTYTHFHHPTCTGSDIVALRRLHGALDYIIMVEYGWDDLDLHHDVYPDERGQIRYTVVPYAHHHSIWRLTDYGIMVYQRSVLPSSDVSMRGSSKSQP
jgi:hypothetical protein